MQANQHAPYTSDTYLQCNVPAPAMSRCGRASMSCWGNAWSPRPGPTPTLTLLRLRDLEPEFGITPGGSGRIPRTKQFQYLLRQRGSDRGIKPGSNLHIGLRGFKNCHILAEITEYAGTFAIVLERRTAGGAGQGFWGLFRHENSEGNNWMPIN